MNLVGWKQLPNEYRRDVIVSVVRLSLFLFALRLLLVVITSGWSAIIDQWLLELGWFLIFIVLMSFGMMVGLILKRRTEKNQSSDSD
jgi:hypothetical protein